MNLVSTNPKTAKSVTLSIQLTNAEDVSEIVDGVAKASAILASKSRSKRATLLNSIAEQLEKNREELIRAADYETALGETRLNGELTRTIYQLNEFADVVRKGTLFEAIIDHPSDSPMGPKPDLRRILRPIGPVAVFGASNFPFAFSVCGGDTSSAIAAGNSVVVKAHSSHLQTALLSFQAMQAAFVENGFDENAVGIVFGQEAARALVEAEKIAAVGFTGSVHGGRFLFDIANARPNPIPFYGELGSVNPLVVTPAAAAARASQIAADYAASITLGGGQFCTKPGLIFIPASNRQDFQKHLAEEFNNTNPTWLLNESTYKSYVTTTEQLAKHETIHESFESLNELSSGFSVKPQLFWTSLSDAEKHRELIFTECFGPMAIAIEYQELSQVTEFLRSMPGALAAAIHGEEIDTQDAAVQELAHTLSNRVGRLQWNGYPTGVAVSWSQTHGGPYPASTSSLHTSVGATAIRRFMRPVTYQNMPEALLPTELVDNPASGDAISRIVDTE